MLKPTAMLATVAAVLCAMSAPAFAQDSLTPRSVLIADLSRDVDAISGGRRSEARIARSAPVDMPAFERLANLGGTVQIEIALDDKGSLTNAAVRTSSGHARLDRSALDAVRASTYAPASIDGHAVGGRYLVEVVFDPAVGL